MNRLMFAFFIAMTVSACAGQEVAPPAASTAPAADEIPPTRSPYDALPDDVQLALDKPFTGDFDALVKRRVIRVGVTFNRTHYFVDKGQERGITYESLKLFEGEL